MAIVVFAADPSLVNLDNTAKFNLRLDKGCSDVVSHSPSGFERAKAHVFFAWPTCRRLLLAYCPMGPVCRA